MASIIQNKEALRAYVYKSHEDISRDVIIEAQNLAEADAQPGQIKISETGIISRYEGLVEYVRQTYQSVTEQAQDRFDLEREAEAKGERCKRMSEAKEDKRIAEAERRKHRGTYQWSKFWLIVILEAFAFLAETSYNVFSLTVGSGTILFSIIPAFVVAVSLSAIAVYMGTALRDKPSHERKGMIWKFSLGLLIVFIALSVLRSFAAFGEGSILFSTATIIGACAFVAIQALIFAGAVFIAMELPSREDRLTKREHDRLSKRIKEADTVIAECKRQESASIQARNEKRKARIDLVGEQSHLESLIASLCKQALSAFYLELALRKPSIRFDHSIGSTPLFQNN